MGSPFYNFTLNDCTRFIQCVKKQSPSIVSSPSISKLACATLFYCVLDPYIQVYNINSVPDHLSYFEQLLDKILNDFRDVFPSKLPHRLPPKRNKDNRIELLLGVAPISIYLYQLSRSEEDNVSKQLKEYLRMGYY